MHIYIGRNSIFWFNIWCWENELYKNNEFIDSDIVDDGYWNGENGGKQIFEDDSIFCYLGRGYVGSSPGHEGGWNYGKIIIYSLRLYNRQLRSNHLSMYWTHWANGSCFNYCNYYWCTNWYIN